MSSPRTKSYWLLFAAGLAVLQAFAAEPKPLFRIGVQEGLAASFNSAGKMYWSHGVVADIFQNQGYEVQMLELSSRRIPTALAEDKVDCVVAHVHGLENYQDSFQSSRFPIFQVAFFIYYKQNKGWEPVWPPDEVFRKKLGLSRQSASILQQQYGLNISWVRDFDEAVRLVNLERSDYWLENGGGLALLESGTLKSAEDGFQLKHLYSKNLHAWFQRSDVGSKYLELFDREQRKLLEEGEYGRAFYDGDPNANSVQDIDQLVTYLNDLYPDIRLPHQKSLLPRL